MRLTLCSLLLIVLIVSCKSSTDAEVGTGDSIKIEKNKMDLPVKAQLGEISNEVDSVLNLKIKSVSILGNYLEIEFTFRGGCEEHRFDFVGSTKIAKSLPPIRIVQLVNHVSKPDLCKKMIIQKMKIDISELAYKKEKGSEIFLSIKGWDEKVKYIFEAN